ncbi:MAG: hypothetical protein ACLQJR_07985 [Stellaceae bacterium]
MWDGIRAGRPGRSVGDARRRPMDPLLKSIVMDLLITTGGFLLTVVAVVLAVQGLSLN